MDQGTEFATIEAKAERLVRAWFPSFRPISRQRKFSRFYRFFIMHNRFYNWGSKSTRRVIDDKFLFSAFVAGIGISTPATRWIVLRDVAVSSQGERIPTSALVNLLGSGRWFVKP